MSFTKTTEEKNPKPQKNTEHESQGNKNAMVCMSLNFGYLCSGSSLPPELKQSEGHSTLLREGTAPSDSCSCWSSGKLHFPMKTENSSDSKVAVPTPCNLRSPIYSWLMQLCDSFAIAFRGFFFCTDIFCQNIGQILYSYKFVLTTVKEVTVFSASSESAVALHVVSEYNAHVFCSVCRSSVWCGSSDAQWISRSWSFQKQQVFTQHATTHVSVGPEYCWTCLCQWVPVQNGFW